ncbi:TetR family transcriptional regulator [Actinomadura sp. DC4]|uniref:acyl-CoA-like ligand-binding transcription factor n=1 Tax=Actinomadura sp. DC4 TaxID=3055069 RepID=UPI0025B1F148|nr:TetR family transcriptional regulator [Actinomadura sp. DC4]MDN3351682.1 TetR family transcriptional regulator [Actinomadura sp. DC4]
MRLSEGDRAVPGLRERKKAKTKAAIQEHAVRLFRAQGYDATTVEQIAEAAEVSPSTVFRYYPTKEDLVITDDYDPVLIAAFRAQPPGLSPIQVLRGALRETFVAMSSGELNVQRERILLVLSVPALWGASLNNLTENLWMLTDMVAAREGGAPDDAAVRTFSGAVFGVMLEVMFRWAKDPGVDAPAELDRALAHLEAGLPFPPKDGLTST